MTNKVMDIHVGEIELLFDVCSALKVMSTNDEVLYERKANPDLDWEEYEDIPAEIANLWVVLMRVEDGALVLVAVE